MIHEDLLQQYIEQLESGAPLQDLIDKIPAENINLRMEVEAAAHLIATPHPQADARARAAGKQRLLLESNLQSRYPKSNTPRQPGFGWLLPLTVVALLLVLVVLGSAAGAGILVARNNAARSAVVDSVSGYMEISRTAESGWQVLSSGDRIRAGQTLRTSGNASAVIQFSDGSRTIVGPLTTIRFDQLDRGPGETVNIRLAQLHGASSHRVIPFEAADSVFIVDTPSGGARVRGTEFSVSVADNGTSRFSVDKGTIAVAGVSRQVLVGAGQTTGLGPGEDPEEPAFQFTLQGTISSITGDIWTISGVAVYVTPDSQLLGSPLVGDSVYVEGRILAGQSWIADQIISEDSAPISSMTGQVEVMGEQTWTISGRTFLVSGESSIDEGIKIGTSVKVIFTIQEDGQWQALSIRSLEENGGQPVPTVTPEGTPDPAAQPDLAFTPNELFIPACSGPSAAFVTLLNTATEEVDVARGVQLGFEIIQNPGLVEAVQLVPDGFEQIDSGETAQFRIVTYFNAAWEGAPDGTEVKIRIFVADISNQPDHLSGDLAVTYIRTCVESPTPTMAPAPDGTPTAIPEDGATTCTGANPHPTGLKLATRFSVTYEEIMGWFCQGFGFGEIELAYGLSLESGLPVTEIFAMHNSGLGWGQIKQELSAKGNPGKPPGGPPNGKPEKKP